MESIYKYFSDLDIKILVTGRVEDHPDFYKDRLFFNIKADKIEIENNNGIRGTIKADGVLPARLNTDDRNILIRDDFIRFKCQVKKNKYHYYLFGYDDGIERFTCRCLIGKIYYFRSKLYNCIRCLFYNNLNYSTACLSESIVLGNTKNFPERISLDFKRSGIYHLLAISGLHISFFIFILSSFVRAIFFKNNFSSRAGRAKGFILIIMIIISLVFYNFLVGTRASMLRSTMMSVCFLIATFLGREAHRKIVLSYVFILLLTINPQFFLDTGFWLTFTAVFAIIYANEPFIQILLIIKNRLPAARGLPGFRATGDHGFFSTNFFITSFVTTLSVNIFLFPILLYIFKEASLLCPMTNLLAIPVFYVILFILVISSFFVLFIPQVGEVIVRTSQVFAGLLFKIAGAWKFFRFGFITIPEFGLAHLIIYYIFLLSFLIIVTRVIKSLKSK